MAKPQQIENALGRVRDQRSFVKELLAGALEWPIDDHVEALGDISFEWSEAELRAQGLNKQLAAGQVSQIQPLRPDQPWGVFILEFKRPEVFTTGRGMTGPLRRVLRGLVPSRRRQSNLATWKQEHLLFICTHNYQHYRFAYFKTPMGETKTAPLAAFGWSPDEPARTACELNLPELVWPDRGTSPADWIERWAGAFDVEKVTKRFFEQYREVDKHVRGHVARAMGEGNIDADSVKLFTQTLLNRLMFLRFIERKGWLRPPGNDRSRDYLRELFAGGGYRGKSFYSGRLKKLFFEGLAIEGKQESEAIGRVPFLNGGLFEEQKGLDDKVDDIADEAFAPLLGQAGGEPGLFYRYNFTVQESTPLDVEVAVDPEMLGKVFEELVTGRHESGSYFTPRPVVSFMCREALKGYLADVTQIDEAKIAAFVDRHETPFDISQAKKIAAALDELKAVDPACGSGAYLLGLLHEMVALYQLLYSDKLKKDARSVHKLKLDIIERNLYGVDKDPFATNIAMLRLWLSLAVDSDTPEALPNLDFKIEAGDSLTGPDPQKFSELFLQEPAIQLAIMKGKYLRAHSDEKKALRQLVLKEQKELAYKLRSLCPGAIDWRVQFCEVFFRARGGFDIVLANPPYIRQELIKDLKPALKKVYGDEFSGTADLYVFFYLRGLQLLAKGGMLVFISSNKWFRAGYGQKLRSLIARQTSVRTILDFHDLPVFESAIAYPMIFVAAKHPPADSDVPTLAEPPTLDPPYPDITGVVVKHGQPLPRTALGGDGTWHLASSLAAERLKRMRAAGAPLGTIAQDLFFRGVVTGLNEAFYIDERLADEWRSRDEVYAKFVKRAIRGEHARRYSINDVGIFLLRIPDGLTLSLLGHDLPQLAHRERASIVKEHRTTAWKAFQEYLPEVAQHLARFQQSAIGRDDQGDFWWELRPCDYYSVFESHKIVFPQTGKEGRFTVDTFGFDLDQTVYTIATSDRFLLAVLNSKPAEMFLKETTALARGGYLRFLTQYLKTLPIPAADAADRAAIAALAQKCMDAKGVGCETWEREIDQRVAALYGIELADIEQTSRPTPIYETKAHLESRVIPKLGKATAGFPYFSLEAIRKELKGHRGEVEPESLNRYLHELTKEGVIFDAGRGWYSTLREPFVLDRESVRELVEVLEKRFPFLEFSCWSTAQIAAYGHHQLARFVSFLYTDRDSMESVADALREAGQTVYINPTQAEVGRNVRLTDGVVIVRPAITRAPVDGRYATIEKILVDLYKEAEVLRLMDEAEYRQVALNAVSQGRISVSTLVGYAEDRRNVPAASVLPLAIN